MKRLAFWWPAAAIVVAVAIGFGAVAHACNVPVFRFALERWRPDPYRVVLFHRGPLSDTEREMIRPLEEQQDKALANLAVRTVDLADESALSEESAADHALFEAVGKPGLPWFVVQYPAHLRIPKPAWAGPLNREFVAAAIDSPIRRELARRLVDGQTAVWLLLESGEPEKDDSAAKLLEEQLKKLEQELELPELTASPEDALATALPLKVKFSLIRVPRNVSEEHALVAMLIGSEPDLAERSDAMVFPVFGRGRALLPLVGAGITAKNIEEAAAFLTGPCSCEVKEQNPGFDLLLAAGWDALLSQSGIALTAVETHSLSPTGQPELVPIPSGAGSPSAAVIPLDVTQPGPFLVPIWAILAGGLVVTLVIAGFIAVTQVSRSDAPGK
jgi:hypothetical protein